VQSAQRIPTAVNLGFLDQSRYCFIQVAPQLPSRGWVDPVPDPLLLRKSVRAGNRNRDLWICSQKLWPLDHRGGLLHYYCYVYVDLHIGLRFLEWHILILKLIFEGWSYVFICIFDETQKSWIRYFSCRKQAEKFVDLLQLSTRSPLPCHCK
jgi:hypothetical protein